MKIEKLKYYYENRLPIVCGTCAVSPTLSNYHREMEKALPALLKIAEAAKEIATVEGEDIPGIDYLIMNMDRKAWASLKSALAELEASDGKA